MRYLLYLNFLIIVTTGSITNSEGEVIKEVSIRQRLKQNTFRFNFKIDLFEKNNISFIL